MWLSLGAVTVAMVFLAATMRFSENITDFLPLGSDEREAMEVYQKVSGADRIVCLFSNPGDIDLTIEAIDRFASLVREKDTALWCTSLTTAYDMDRIRSTMEFAYENVPYFLDENDYIRIDSLLSQPGYIAGRLREDRTALLFPSGGMAETAIARDPLGLFSPVMRALSGNMEQNSFELYDGYVFTPDGTRAIVWMRSPFGNGETRNNSVLVAMLQEASDEVMAEYPGIDIHLTGGPVIAVGNSDRIKRDTVISVAVSTVLILAILLLSFGSIFNILLIVLTIGWGWLFAVGGMSLLSDHVSIIVIGLSSVILGIAVNYPLHLVAHVSHRGGRRSAVGEIASPLVVGNVTTVGAFLALVPLQSEALRALGIFASLLLVGTIVFVLVYLPHMAVQSGGKDMRCGRIIPLLAELRPEKCRPLVVAVIVLTAVLGYFSTGTRFSSDLSDINYMTESQRADMAYFRSLFPSGPSHQEHELLVVSKGGSFDEALAEGLRHKSISDSLAAEGKILSSRSVNPFLSTLAEQQRRLLMWKEFAARFNSGYGDEFRKAAVGAGFSTAAFTRFETLLSQADDFRPQDIDYFEPLAEGPLSSCLTTVGETCCIVESINVDAGDIDAVSSRFDNCFDISLLDNALAESLSDNFNYIGWACSLIVFFFLWFSFGSFSLALISFLPMAISWVWILGLMSVLGIEFNIVNIILATFIFGQGDDYTIFVTEGCQYEYARGKPIMASYKSSIIQSALIMFVGIGTLIVARHPAMKSLAEVTIIGMFSVVLMAYLIPPLLFGWMTTKDGKRRQYPLSLRTLLLGAPDKPEDIVMGRYMYKGNGICREVRRNLASASGQDFTEEGGEILVRDSGYGESAILAAYLHPEAHVKALMNDEDRMLIAAVSARDFVGNIEFIKCDIK